MYIYAYIIYTLYIFTIYLSICKMASEIEGEISQSLVQFPNGCRAEAGPVWNQIFFQVSHVSVGDQGQEPFSIAFTDA